MTKETKPPERDSTMKQIQMVVWVGLAAIALLPQEAFARNRMYNPATGSFMQRDPAGTDLAKPSIARNLSGSQYTQRDQTEHYRDGMSLYQYVRSNPAIGRDPMGLEDQRTACEGVCGGSIDDWIRDEIKAQLAGANASFGGKKPSIGAYLRWANGNQRYKDPKFFEFSKDVEGCGTKPDKSKPGCGHSVTLCGKCVRSAILGNIMYGYIGAQLGFSKKELRGASDTKSTLGLTVDKYDEAAYDLGADLQGGYTPSDPPASGPATQSTQPIKGSLEDLCAQVDHLLTENGDALKEGNDNGYNDLSTCKPCEKKTKETRHGGKEESKWLP